MSQINVNKTIGRRSRQYFGIRPNRLVHPFCESSDCDFQKVPSFQPRTVFDRRDAMTGRTFEIFRFFYLRQPVPRQNSKQLWNQQHSLLPYTYASSNERSPMSVTLLRRWSGRRDRRLGPHRRGHNQLKTPSQYLWGLDFLAAAVRRRNRRLHHTSSRLAAILGLSVIYP